MLPENEKNASIYLIIEDIMLTLMQQKCVIGWILSSHTSRKRKSSEEATPYQMIERMPNQVKHLNRMVRTTDRDCIINLRMDRNAFGRLCIILRQLGGLSDGKYVSVEEQVAMFLSILAHHKKNSVISFDFMRSGQTVSHYVHIVLRSVIMLHEKFLVKPKPVPADCTDPRWSCFKGCLGALDGSYISVLVPNLDKPRYRTRKGQICTNTLAACDRDLNFTFVLPGWEGSAADSRVLRDAINREHGLKVPRGNYYLCDNGYANSEGFLTPYKGVRYHLKEWGPDSARPQNAREIFNMRHTKARNVIERGFGVIKMRFGILRSATYYPVKIQNRLIMACFLLHDFIRSVMEHDPIEDLIDSLPTEDLDEAQHQDEEFVDHVESTAEWNLKRDEIAESMWLLRG